MDGEMIPAADTEIRVLGEPSYDGWMQYGERLSDCDKRLQWAIGDWLNYGKVKWDRGRYDAGVALFPQYERKTLRTFAEVARKIETPICMGNLSWAHHQLVAPLEHAEQVGFLKQATAESLTVREFARVIRDRHRTVPPPMPEGQYRVIYADPPWSYSNNGFKQSAESHYPTMHTDEICALPVGDLAGDGSVVFLWATSPLLPDALRVLEAWGCNYKASMVWIKPSSPGIGWFYRTRHEFLLTATFGGNEHPATTPDSVLEHPRSVHSQKPTAVYDTIEEMYPGPYVELFARNKRDGWATWGNE